MGARDSPPLDLGLASVLLIGPPAAGGHLLAPDTATLEKRC